MVGFIVTGHGSFAKGLLSSLELITGKTENIIGVDFTHDVSPKDLEQKINDAYKELNCKEVVIFTDLVGGTPFKTSVKLKLARKNIEVLSGTNLSMLGETVFLMDKVCGKEIKKIALNAGKNGIQCYEMKEKKIKYDSSEGI